MCGITGILGCSDKGLIKKMNNTIRYRGPDDSGYYIDDYICLGIRRLSIIDLKKGNQPIHNEEKNIWIVFNGEIYNFEELKKNLKNHRFYTNTDTEPIIHCYEEYGEKFISKLRGMFAFALWDSKKKVLILARDRLGIKPLYYTLIGDKLLFASEIKALLKDKDIKKDINLQSLYNYLSFRYVTGNETILKNIYKLEPGHVLKCKIKKEKIDIIKTEYWKPSFEVTSENKNFYLTNIRKMLDSCVKTHLMSEVPLGAYLSGGIDSSSVVAFMSKYIEKVNTFTVGFGEENDELKYAKLVSENFGTEHKEVIIDVKELPKNFEKIIWHLDEPVADPASIPTFFMSKFTKRYVKVLLTGEGADEQFGGYYKRYSMMANRFLPFKKQIYERMLSTFPEKNKKEALKLKIPRNMKTTGLNFIRARVPSYLFEIGNWLPNDLLLKVDRMTMAHSLEARVPFLDHKFVEFNLSIPIKLKIKGGVEKYILKEALKPILPIEIIKRRKQSFTVPLNKWFREENLLEPLYNSEIFNKEYINKIKDKKPRQLYSMLVFELWYRLFIQNERLKNKI